MSFGGFFGSSSGGDASLLVDNLYTTNTPVGAAIGQHQLFTPPVFNSPALSLALKPKMEGLGEMGLIGENYDPGSMLRSREDEYESKSGSENLEAASGDDQETPRNNKSRRKKKYHRHTPYQIQELESSFKENPHPDEKQRLELGKKLSLESKQVKFWFQNRRTQMKTQLERHENLILKQQNDKLRIENIAIKEAMRNPICNGCGGAAVLGELSIEEHHLRIENARLKDELNRICALANKFLGTPLSPLAGSLPPAMSNSNLELGMGRNGFGPLGPVDGPPLPVGLDFSIGIPNALHVGPSSGMTGVDIPPPFDKSFFVELALAAMDELVKLAQIGDPLWFRSLDGTGETLNFDEYMRIITPCVDMKQRSLITEGTRAMGISTFSSSALVEMMMDANQWAEMFPGMVGGSSTLDVIASGMGGTRNGALQLMHAEIQVISPMVPARQVRFLRFCKQHGDRIWAVVDVSIDTVREGPIVHCRRLPSGCILQDMPNGYSKITWVEHSEYDEGAVDPLYRAFLRSGIGFGAQRWVATLQRQCDFLATIMTSTVPSEDHSGITPDGRRSMAKLAKRMTRNFCAGVCGTVHKWEVVPFGNNVGGEHARLMIRQGGIHNAGEPSGLFLSATMSVWMPVLHQQLFDLLQNEQLRNQWDILSHGRPLQQMIHIPKGQDRGNGISLLRASASSANSNQNDVLILQETSTDTLGSLIVTAPVDMSSMNMVMNGGDSASVPFLPSGFAIVPDCFPDSGGPNGAVAKDGGGSLLTMGLQILVSSLPAAKLTMESVETVNNLLSRTIAGIKEALNCN